MTIQMIPLQAIQIDKNLWPRQTLDEMRVKEFKELYEADMNILPPLDIVPNGKGYSLADGWHRYHALKALKKDAPCKILPAETDIYLYALEQSAVSQKPLTRHEKRQSVLRLLAEYHSKSDREIARLCGVSHPMVHDARHNFVTRSHIKREKEAPGNSTTTISIPPQAQLQPHTEFIIALQNFLKAYPSTRQQAGWLINAGYILQGGIITPYSPLTQLIQAINEAQHIMKGNP